VLHGSLVALLTDYQLSPLFEGIPERAPIDIAEFLVAQDLALCASSF
jgi:hypothetical protein